MECSFLFFLTYFCCDFKNIVRNIRYREKTIPRMNDNISILILEVIIRKL